MRSGFTLFEILLVLAILVVVMALAYPALESMYADYRLSAAADQIRAAWQTARSEAMEKGRPYRFSIVPGQGNFRIAPDSADYWGGGEPASAGEGDSRPVVIEGVVEKGIRISTPSTFAPITEATTTTAAETPAGSVSPEQWVSMAVFFPDGSAEADAEVFLQMANAKVLALRLRALTGVISSQVLNPEEIVP